MSTFPIADLSYRNYDGPLSSPRVRWWVIAKTSLLLSFKKKSYWVLTVFAGGYYLLFMAIVFFLEQAAGAQPAGQDNLQEFLLRIVWKDQFVHGISTGQIWYLMISLLVGAGSIANDNRANALLVYLSKPCTRTDYLLGKWVGVFLAMGLSILLPTAFFFLYGALSYAQYGFLIEDPWLGPKLLVFIVFSAAFHASLVVGISSLFRQGRSAGATYAGIYFLTNFFTQIMAIRWASSFIPRRGGSPDGSGAVGTMVERLYYASVDGLHIGMVKGILRTDGTPYFGINSSIPSVPQQPLWAVGGIALVISLAMVALAWTRIRAVEVVN